MIMLCNSISRTYIAPLIHFIKIQFRNFLNVYIRILLKINVYIFRFYTLLVISTALFNKPPFKNLIANGLVLASDGQKMSKRKKNYPDPLEV